MLFCICVFAGCSISLSSSEEQETAHPDEQEEFKDLLVPELGPSSGPGSSDVALQFSVTTDTECPDGEINEDFLHKNLNFHSGDLIYLVADLTIYRFQWAEENFQLIFDMSPLRALDITLYEASTGLFSESITDDHLVVGLTYSVPENRAEERNYRIVFQVVVKGSGTQLQVRAFFQDFDETYTYRAGVGAQEDAALPEHQRPALTREDVAVRFAVTTDEECPRGKLREEAFHDDLTILGGDRVYLVADFTVDGFEWAEDRFGITFELSSKDDYDVALIDANAQFLEKYSTGDHQSFTLTYAVPEDRTEKRDYRVVFSADALRLPREQLRMRTLFLDLADVPFDYEVGFDYTFELNQDNTYTLVSTNASEARELVIPSGYHGLPVTRIAERAFYENQELDEILLPSSLKEIGAQAFAGTALKFIEIPASVERIEESLFEGSALTSISIPSSVKEIGAKAFAGSALRSITVPSSLEIIEESLFEGSALTSINLSYVTTIQARAFYNCPLESIRIPSSVKRIEREAFFGCNQLQSVEIGNLNAWCKIAFNGVDANPIHCSDHVYYGSSLLRQISFPGGLTEIASYAFYGCTQLESINFGDVSTVGDYAFYGCTALRGVEANQAFQSVGTDAFAQCSVDSLRVHKSLSYASELCRYFPQVKSAECSVSEASNFTIPAGKLNYCLFGTSNNIKITAAYGSEAHILFRDISLSGAGPLDLTNVDQAYLTFVGTNTVSSDSTAYPALKASGLILEGTTNLASLSFSGKDGQNGTVGGNGFDGTNGKKGSGDDTDRSARAGSDGTDGGAGTNGTNGGDAAVVGSLTVKSGHVRFSGDMVVPGATVATAGTVPAVSNIGSFYHGNTIAGQAMADAAVPGATVATADAAGVQSLLRAFPCWAALWCLPWG